jgi:hypothetical protein
LQALLGVPAFTSPMDDERKERTPVETWDRIFKILVKSEGFVTLSTSLDYFAETTDSNNKINRCGL